MMSDRNDDQPDIDGTIELATTHEADGQDAPIAGSKMSGRTKLILVVLFAIVLVAGIAWYMRYQSTGQYLQETNDAQIRADAVTVSPRSAGYVAEVLVADNQDVVAGQPLVRLDLRTFKAQAAQAEAQIAVANATADSTRATIREQYATIDQARAQLAAAKAKAAADAAEVARYTPLAASGAEPREKLAQLRTAAIQSAGDARAAEAALVIQQRKVASLTAQVRQGEAQAENARAQLDAASVDVNGALIRAPIAGRIGDKTVTVGQYAQTGTRLMSIVPLDKLYIVANFKETQIGRMRVGQAATITVDALDGIELHGRVVSTAPGTGAQFSLLPPENATGNFTKIVQRVPVRISVDAGPETRKLLLPGLSLSVTVDTISAKGAKDRIADEQDRLNRQKQQR